VAMQPEEEELFRRLQSGILRPFAFSSSDTAPGSTGSACTTRAMRKMLGTSSRRRSSAYKGVRQFRGDSALSTWLTRIAMNLCLNFRRDRRTAATLLDQREDLVRTNMPPVAPPGPEEELRRRELADRIRGLVATLPRRERMAFVMKFYNDMKIKENQRGDADQRRNREVVPPQGARHAPQGACRGAGSPGVRRP